MLFESGIKRTAAASPACRHFEVAVRVLDFTVVALYGPEVGLQF